MHDKEALLLKEKSALSVSMKWPSPSQPAN